ncbi:heavy metal-associated isoprenylated plant protein 32-like [Impatiens glandulifera]|uniref:heavy metal-associated isoprenylated plant protein 32-like n=1 Tax=Impatiens glandulifera TaxID=253017 RepID=UPI001FB069C8|nr:heavy metal-associated isoprenylated plant protein 32-like [Impatiens glandulifera]
MSKEEFLKAQTCVLKVNIHCDGCKDKVKKILQKIDGVYTTKIDAEQGKVTVSGNVEAATLIKKLAKNGKHAEIWGGATKPANNNLNNQLKNVQIEQAKSGNVNKGGQKGSNQPKGGAQQQQKQQGLNPQQPLQQKQQGMMNMNPQLLQQMKGFQDLSKLPPQAKDLGKMGLPNNPNQIKKTVKFKLPEEDELSDEFDEDEFDDEDDYDDDELDDDTAYPPSQQQVPNKGKPNFMGNGQGGGKQQQMGNMMMNVQNKGGGGGGNNGGNAKKGAGGGGGGNAPVQMNGGKKDGGGGNGNKNQNQGGGGGKNGGCGGGGSFDGKNGNNNINGNGFTKLSNGFPPNISSVGGGGGMGQMSQMGHMGGGGMPISGAAHGLPAMAAGPPGGYFAGSGVDGSSMGGGGGGNQYYQQQQQQQMAAMMMNQQRANGNERFQPMMYARAPPAVNYMPMMYPYPSSYPPYPPPPDPYTHAFSDENTSSCTLM